MTLRPGSALWLLRHELRLYYFRMGGASASKGRASRGSSRSNIVLIVLASAGLHAFAYLLLPSLAGEGSAPAVLIGIGMLCAAAFSLMVSQGLKTSVEVLFERGDMDLLLSSPLPSRSLFVVRLGAVAIGTASLYLFLLAPFAHVGVLLGQPHWLAIYPLVLGAAVLAASLSMLLTLALVRLIGIRRTRVAAQILGALVGALFFLLSQVYANSSGLLRQRVANWFAVHSAAGGAFAADSPLWLPARASQGDGGALLTVALLGLLAFILTAHWTHGFFVRGVQQAASLVKHAAAPAGGQRYRFGRSLARTIFVKEWRLIARDPQLISQVLLQLLYLLPLCFLVVVKSPSSVPGLGASLTYLCASLTTALAWLMIAAEDAPDLLRAAPASAATVARAKLAAAVAPALLLLAAPLLWLLWRAPLTALPLALCASGASVGAALVVRWCAPPAARGDFRQRAKGNFLNTFLELATAMAWTGLAMLALTVAQTGRLDTKAIFAVAALVALLLGLMAVAWTRRRR
ncbi:putative ABC transporter permease subunit [Massilia sp. PWRC2]|uniref:putative ABC transporter permease subunit n=1 Tax=Massilia sp. PWRC2 TaxID=2804626 RepID=UPI003CF22978